MKNLYKLTVVFLAVYIALHGCAADKMEKPAPFIAASVVISTSTESAQAFASVLQARDFFLTSTNLYKNLGEIAVNIMTTDPTLAGANTAIVCADGGSFLYSGATTTTGGYDGYDLTVKFNGCRDKRFQYDGEYTVSAGTPEKLTVKLGGTGVFNIFYFNSAYTVLIDYLKASVSFTMAGSAAGANAVYTIIPTGTIDTFDYFLLDTFTMNYANISTDYALSIDQATGNETTSLSVNGSFTETSEARALTITLTGFNIEQVKRKTAGSFSADDTTLSGAAEFNYRPNDYCFEGQYSVATTTPIHNDYALGHTTQGVLTLNGIATAQYKQGGDIDVSVSGATPLNYAREFELMKMCDYSAMEGDIPPLLGPTGSAVGDTMAVTLTWVDNTGSTSDMDLHVKYYNTTLVSSPTTTETWHIDWHQGKTCGDPSGLTFSDAFDFDGSGSGSCDVGLDFDDTNGYGPEHITALKLPVGYYVVSVNSYGLGDPPATLFLAIHIGDYIFGPYIGTLSSSDGEGEDPASWYRVADVRVNEDGTVDVLTPDTSLNPWH
jgi:hypothetical protein